MNVKILKIVLGLFLFIFFMAPVVNYHTLDLEQAEKNIRIALEKREKMRAYLTGRFDQTKHPDFVIISERYSMGGVRMYLRKEAYADFIRMHQAAARDGVNLLIASATRNFDYQTMLWNRKWSTYRGDEVERFNKILEYSAAPSTSRHHWGTEIDINGADPAYFSTPVGIRVYDWLSKNAKDYGFCQTYNEKGGDRMTGYNEEKWHWSYLPLARDFTQEYKEIVNEEDIYGFGGDTLVAELNLIENYVLGINPECL